MSESKRAKGMAEIAFSFQASLRAAVASPGPWLLLAALLAGIGLGWHGGRFTGALTGVTVALMSSAISFAQPLWSRHSEAGVRQRVIAAVGLVLIPTAAYLGGWQRGYVWALLTYFGLAVARKLAVSSALAWRLAAAVVPKVARSPKTLSKEQQMSVELGLVIPYTYLDILLDRCLVDPSILVVLDRCKAWTKDLERLHEELVRAGGGIWVRGRQVAAAAIADPVALEFVLRCIDIPSRGKVSALLEYFRSGKPLPIPPELDFDLEGERHVTEASSPSRPPSTGIPAESPGRRSSWAILTALRRGGPRAFLSRGWAELLHGSYREAMPQLEQSVALARARYEAVAAESNLIWIAMAPSVLYEYSLTLLYLGKGLEIIGDPEAAREMYHRTFKVLDKLRFHLFCGTAMLYYAESLISACLLGLGVCSFRADDLDRALQFIKAASLIAGDTYGYSDRALAVIFITQAEVERRMGNLDSANIEPSNVSLEAAGISLSYAREILRGKPSQLEAALAVIEARVEVDRKHLSVADDRLREAVDICSVDMNIVPSVRLAALSELALLQAEMAKHDEAHSAIVECFGVLERNCAAVFSFASEAHRAAYLGDAHAVLQTLVAAAAKAPRLEDRVRAVFDGVLRNKALGGEAIAFEREDVLKARPDLESIRARVLELGMWIAARELSRPWRRIQQSAQVLVWKREQERLQAQLVHELPTMSLFARLSSVDHHRCAQALPGSSALIEYLHVYGRERRYVAFVLVAGTDAIPQLIDLGPAATIESAIAAHHHVLELGLADTHPGREVAFTVRKAIFDPLEDALKGCRRLFVAPDGAIARLPLEVLPDGVTGHLIDSFIVSYLTCGRDAIRFGASPMSPSSPPVVIGDPDFDLASGGEPHLKRLRCGPDRFERLLGAHEEAVNVAKVLGVDPIIDSDALEGRLKHIIRGPQILHLATHGFFLQDPPETKLTSALNIDPDPTVPARLVYYENPVLRSGIALAGANRWILGEAMPPEAEDGIMTGADVAGLSLSGTELVVLSACQTGLGVVQIGEGIIGLSSAFLAAGAQTVVASLWQVKDLATGQLMVTFYEALREGTPRVEALTRSRRALKEILPNPATWGPFVCIGDPGPLALPR